MYGHEGVMPPRGSSGSRGYFRGWCRCRDAMQRGLSRPSAPSRVMTASSDECASREGRSWAVDVKSINLLAISGSLRAGSSNTALLEAASRLAPQGCHVELWHGMQDLPHFNPDLEEEGDLRLPVSVRDLRRRVGAADGLIVSTPEYAHGLPGSFKNLLDWLVGDTEFAGKPVAVLSPSARAVHARGQLAEILLTMSARLIADPRFVVQLPARDMDASAIVANAETSAALRTAVAEICALVSSAAADASPRPLR